MTDIVIIRYEINIITFLSKSKTTARIVYGHIVKFSTGKLD
jgi:hypothetical protein